jgi:hypothetical protein
MPRVPCLSDEQRATGTISHIDGLQAQGRSTTVARSLDLELTKDPKDPTGHTASVTPKTTHEQGMATGGATAPGTQQALITKTTEGLYHAYDEHLINTYFPGLNKDTLEKLLTLTDLNDDDQRALRETFEPEQIAMNLDQYYLANALCQPALCERAMNHQLIEKNKSGVMINPWRTNTSMRGYGPEIELYWNITETLRKQTSLITVNR